METAPFRGKENTYQQEKGGEKAKSLFPKQLSTKLQTAIPNKLSKIERNPFENAIASKTQRYY